MLDITVSYRRLRLQLFPRLLSKRSKEEHIAGLQKVAIRQLHNWLPTQERWQEPPAQWLRPGGRAEREGEGWRDGGGKEHTCPTVSLLLHVSLPPHSHGQITQGFCCPPCSPGDIKSFSTLRNRHSVKPKVPSRAK